MPGPLAGLMMTSILLYTLAFATLVHSAEGAKYSGINILALVVCRAGISLWISLLVKDGLAPACSGMNIERTIPSIRIKFNNVEVRLRSCCMRFVFE